MSHDWFYMPSIPAVGSDVELDEAEARHALGARRLVEGDAVTLFDGRGAVAEATLAAAGKRRAAVTITRRIRAAQPRHALTLAAALPKGDRQSVMLSMAAQLGMRRFVPMQCERAVAKPGKGFADRAQRILIEACKQSRQAYVPEIAAPMTPAGLAQHAAAQGERMILAHPSGDALRREMLRAQMTLAVGPEGGLTDAEVASAQAHGAVIVALGEPILRTETAAVALLAWAAFAMQEHASPE